MLNLSNKESSCLMPVFKIMQIKFCTEDVGCIIRSIELTKQ